MSASVVQPVEKRSNYRIVIEPKALNNFGGIIVGTASLYGRGPDAEKRMNNDIIERCEQIAADVRRHIDNVHSVTVEWDAEFQCPYCGALWIDARNEKGKMWCCDKASSDTSKL